MWLESFPLVLGDSTDILETYDPKATKGLDLSRLDDLVTPPRRLVTFEGLKVPKMSRMKSAHTFELYFEKESAAGFAGTVAETWGTSSCKTEKTDFFCGLSWSSDNSTAAATEGVHQQGEASERRAFEASYVHFEKWSAFQIDLPSKLKLSDDAVDYLERMSQTCSQSGEHGEARTQAESHVEHEVRQFLKDFGTHYPMGPVTFGVLAYYTGKAKSEESNNAKDLSSEASRVAHTKRGKGLSIDFTKCFQKLGEAANGAGVIPEPNAEAARQTVQVICAAGQGVAPSGGYSQASEAEEHVANHKGMATHSHERRLETQATKRIYGDSEDPIVIDRGDRLKPIFEIIAEDERLQDKLGHDRVKQLAEIVRRNMMKMDTLCEVCQRHVFPSRLVEHRAACLREQRQLSATGQSMLSDMLRDGYHLFQRDLSDKDTLGYYFMKPIPCFLCKEHWPAWFLNDHWRAHVGEGKAPAGSVKDKGKNMQLFYPCRAEMDYEQLLGIQQGYSLCYLDWVGWNQWPEENRSRGQAEFFFDVGNQLLRAINYCANPGVFLADSEYCFFHGPNGLKILCLILPGGRLV